MADIIARTEYPPSSKGACFLCHLPKREDEKVILDTGVDVDFPATRLVICETCVRWMAHLVGYPSAEEVEQARQESLEARRAAEKGQRSEEKFERLKAELDARRDEAEQLVGRIVHAQKKAEADVRALRAQQKAEK